MRDVKEKSIKWKGEGERGKEGEGTESGPVRGLRMLNPPNFI